VLQKDYTGSPVTCSCKTILFFFASAGLRRKCRRVALVPGVGLHLAMPAEAGRKRRIDDRLRDGTVVRASLLRAEFVHVTPCADAFHEASRQGDVSFDALSAA